MPAWVERLVVRWLRVPAEPEPPAGDPETIRVFRAAPEYFRYKLVGWAIGQVGTLIGLAVGLVIGIELLGDWLGGGLVGSALAVLGVLAWLTFLVQIPFSYAALRLDYELRWYMLSDRALRIREGILRVREMTMTFANIQQISVRQGPIQRLLGIADIEVRTAGGGAPSGEGGQDMHRGYLRGVAEPAVVRDTIRDRVRQYRDAGLGEPAPGGPERAKPGRRGLQARAPEATAAARNLLAEVRELRSALAGSGA